jgi:ubiquinone/menaquinone biosynthesis C-methylase UbiE
MITGSPPTAEHYDRLYGSAYMSGFTDVYEHCRYRTILAVLPDVMRRLRPRRILDVGCGQGRYLDLVRSRFPLAELIGVDFSGVAIAKAREAHPHIAFHVGAADALDMIPDASIDLLLNIEVMEHVVDAARVVREFTRVLRPGGVLLITTPCANRYSLEWLENALTGRIRPTADGFQRFGTDPIEHVRRFTEADLNRLLNRSGFRREWVRFRGHLFTRPCYVAHRLLGRWLPLFGRIAYLDWRLFRALPNGATLIGLWSKPEESSLTQAVEAH